MIMSNEVWKISQRLLQTLKTVKYSKGYNVIMVLNSKDFLSVQIYFNIFWWIVIFFKNRIQSKTPRTCKLCLASTSVIYERMQENTYWMMAHKKASKVSNVISLIMNINTAVENNKEERSKRKRGYYIVNS